MGSGKNGRGRGGGGGGGGDEGGRKGKKIEAGEVSRDRGERKRDGERREKRERERGGKIVWAEQTGIEKEELIKIQIL